MGVPLAAAGIPVFGSSKKLLCTCLPKYSLNTYLGRCAHGCLYCYATKFPSFAGPVRPRLSLLADIEGMARKTRNKMPVMVSDCTDPYQPLEKELKVTRRCIEVLAGLGFPLLIVTKSDLVTRDIDVFHRTPTVVAVTVTTQSEGVSSMIEPNAPSPDRRLSALQEVSDRGIPAVARVDPIIPTVNDGEADFEKLVSTLAAIGVKQVTISTLKPVRGFFSKLERADSGLHGRLSRAYSDGGWIAGYKYLREARRRALVERFRRIVLRHGLAFSSCREGFPELNTLPCDGTYYCRVKWGKDRGFKDN
ncbi:MAG: radical SAM protein [Thermoproteota archaeon]